MAAPETIPSNREEMVLVAAQRGVEQTKNFELLANWMNGLLSYQFKRYAKVVFNRLRQAKPYRAFSSVLEKILRDDLLGTAFEDSLRKTLDSAAAEFGKYVHSMRRSHPLEKDLRKYFGDECMDGIFDLPLDTDGQATWSFCRTAQHCYRIMKVDAQYQMRRLWHDNFLQVRPREDSSSMISQEFGEALQKLSENLINMSAEEWTSKFTGPEVASGEGVGESEKKLAVAEEKLGAVDVGMAKLNEAFFPEGADEKSYKALRAALEWLSADDLRDGMAQSLIKGVELGKVELDLSKLVTTLVKSGGSGSEGQGAASSSAAPSGTVDQKGSAPPTSPHQPKTSKPDASSQDGPAPPTPAVDPSSAASPQPKTTDASSQDGSAAPTTDKTTKADASSQDGSVNPWSPQTNHPINPWANPWIGNPWSVNPWSPQDGSVNPTTVVAPDEKKEDTATLAPSPSTTNATTDDLYLLRDFIAQAFRMAGSGSTGFLATGAPAAQSQTALSAEEVTPAKPGEEGLAEGAASSSSAVQVAKQHAVEQEVPATGQEEPACTKDGKSGAGYRRRHGRGGGAGHRRRHSVLNRLTGVLAAAVEQEATTTSSVGANTQQAVEEQSATLAQQLRRERE